MGTCVSYSKDLSLWIYKKPSNCTKLFTYIVSHSVTVYNIPYAVNATWRKEKRNTLVSVLDRNTTDTAC